MLCCWKFFYTCISMRSLLSIFPAFSEMTDVHVPISTKVNSLHIWDTVFTLHFQENCSNDPVTAFHLFLSSRKNWEGVALRSPLFQASNYSSDGMASALTDVCSVTSNTAHCTTAPCDPLLSWIFLYVKQANLWIISLFTAGRKHILFDVLDLLFTIWMLLSW